ncbi:MAG: 3-oxoacyl-ACP synthase [Marinilabiliales bacterium]|nr:MAG: 3-oxoacyl-ACP synthase [Marinilabiliales bacterium]
MNLLISKYCSVNNNKVILNDKIVYSLEGEQPNVFLKGAYRNLPEKYPKFFKMDALSKLAFVASEYLMIDKKLDDYNKSNIAVIIQNASSTIDVDRKYQETIQDKDSYFPNPSLFVYTLPNIMIGEICIKNKIKGENILFINEKFSPELAMQQMDALFYENKTEACIVGWVEQSGNNYNAVLFFVEKEGKVNDFYSICNTDNLKKIYHH